MNVIKKSKELKYREQANNQSLDKDESEVVFKLNKTEEESFGWTVYSTIVFLTLFFGFLFNYIFSIYLQDVVVGAYNAMVRTTDLMGVDAHFVRLFVLALFEERDGRSHHIPSICLWKDILMILIVVVPLFIIGLRFWTAPTYLKYSLRINALAAPLALLPSFFAYHSDVKALGVLVLVMNVYVFWYHAEPPSEYNDYGGGRRSKDSDDSEDSDIQTDASSERFYKSVEKGADLVRQMSMNQPGMHNMYGFGGFM